MSNITHKRRVHASALGTLILLPAFAAAWTPYGYGPYGGAWDAAAPPAGAEMPPYQSNAGRAPSSGAPGSGYPPYPAGPAFPRAPYDYATPMPGAPFGSGIAPPDGAAESPRIGGPPRFSLSRSSTSDAYIIDIRLDDMEPTQLQVDVQGPWIRIGRQDTREDMREERFDDGRGFVRSYSYSSGSNSRRISLPRDADPDAMRREDAGNSVRIIIPRAKR